MRPPLQRQIRNFIQVRPCRAIKLASCLLFVVPHIRHPSILSSDLALHGASSDTSYRLENVWEVEWKTYVNHATSAPSQGRALLIAISLSLSPFRSRPWGSGSNPIARFTSSGITRRTTVSSRSSERERGGLTANFPFSALHNS